ncbi:MAG: hypothetical protein WC768_01975 [Patescibacteria group bacterium]
MKESNSNSPRTKSLIIPVKTLFSPKDATLLLLVNGKIPGLKLKKTEAEQLGLSKKDEFHFTIIGIDTGAEILKSLKNLNEKERKERLAKIRQLGKQIKWQAILKNDFFYIQKNYNASDLINPKLTIPEKRESIIQLAEIKGLEKFYQKLNLLLGKQLKTHFPHLTLYTTSTREDRRFRGIGINSKNQFEKLKPKRI